MTSDSETPMQNLVQVFTVSDQSTFNCAQWTYTRLQSSTEMQETSSFRETTKNKELQLEQERQSFLLRNKTLLSL